MITNLLGPKRSKSIKPSNQATLLIGDEGCRVAYLSKKRNLRTTFAPNTVEGRAHICDWLYLASIKRIRIVSDQSVQSYSREDIPKASKRDRERILSRRLTARFGEAALTTFSALEQPAEASNTAQSYLMAGVTDDSSIRQWLKDLAVSRIEVTSIGLLPLEWVDILPTLLARTLTGSEARTWQVVITHQRTGGIRHVVLLGDQLILTRLTAEPAGPNETIKERVAESASHHRWQDELIAEIQASIGYIKRFGYSADQKLVINLIGGESFASMVTAQQAGPSGQTGSAINANHASAQGNHGPVWHAHRIGDLLVDLQIKIDLDDSNDLDSHACALLATLFSTRPSRQALTSPFWRERNRQRQHQQLAHGAIAATILGLCGWSSWLAMSWQAQLETTAKLEAELSASRLLHTQLLEQSADLPPDLNNSRDFMQAYDDTHEFEQYLQTKHQAILTALGSDMKLEKLSWKTGQTDTPTIGSDSTVNFDNDGSNLSSPPQGDDQAMTIELEFDLSRADDAGQATDMAEQFLMRLRAELSAHQVDILASEIPYAVDPVTAGSWSAVAPIADATQHLAGNIILQVYDP